MPVRNSERPSLKKPFVVKALEAWETPGTFGEGGGLYLQVRAANSGAVSKAWIFRYRDKRTGKLRDMGLGAFPEVGLAAARDHAAEQRALLRKLIDPIEHRRERLEGLRQAQKTSITFAAAAKRYHEAQRAGWGEKHSQDWINSIEMHVNPKLGTKRVQTISADDVLEVLNPLWLQMPETAGRVRSRIEAVWNFCKGRKLVSGDNPAAWRGNLDTQLPALSKVRKETHHAALPWREIGQFIAALQGQKGAGALALELAILTATRTSEVSRATRGEFDLDRRLWTIPEARMKAGREHVIPLSERAAEIVRAQGELPADSLLFGSGPKREAPSNGFMASVLRRMGRIDLTVHGFRSTFRDWAGESTAFDQRTIEHALAHQLKDRAEAAYARGSHLQKRRALMGAWASFCATAESPAENVVPIRAVQ